MLNDVTQSLRDRCMMSPPWRLKESVAQSVHVRSTSLSIFPAENYVLVRNVSLSFRAAFFVFCDCLVRWKQRSSEFETKCINTSNDCAKRRSHIKNKHAVRMRISTELKEEQYPISMRFTSCSICFGKSSWLTRCTNSRPYSSVIAQYTKPDRSQ